MFAPSELLWALIGLILTIGSTWLEVFVFKLPWSESGGWQLGASSLGVTFQVGAALFTGCMGGKNAAALSQIAYLALGMVLFERFGFQVFTQGAGADYFREPGFGYLLGFIPAGWLCGKLAFRRAQPTLERLALAALSGLALVHLCGLSYLILGSIFRWLQVDGSVLSAMVDYTVVQIPGQVMVACAIALMSYGMRKALFY
ncbi:MAG: biotin transporter BioY [Phormidesmis sp. RL_2_1]|nr:biotin transporter BioY [Phormidesmis sp. RL_2_1]